MGMASAAWSTDTARADALTTQDGVIVKSGTTSRRWVGTIRTTSTTATEDSYAKRYVWNKYNQVTRHLYNSNATQHTYGSATVREWRGLTSTRLEWVGGEAHTISGALGGQVNPNGSVYPGLDSTTTAIACPLYFSTYLVMGNFIRPSACALGYHYLAPLENASASVVFDQVHLRAELLG
jgi:hypothetical protein